MSVADMVSRLGLTRLREHTPTFEIFFKDGTYAHVTAAEEDSYIDDAENLENLVLEWQIYGKNEKVLIALNAANPSIFGDVEAITLREWYMRHRESLRNDKRQESGSMTSRAESEAGAVSGSKKTKKRKRSTNVGPQLRFYTWSSASKLTEIACNDLDRDVTLEYQVKAFLENNSSVELNLALENDVNALDLWVHPPLFISRNPELPPDFTPESEHDKREWTRVGRIVGKSSSGNVYEDIYVRASDNYDFEKKLSYKWALQNSLGNSTIHVVFNLDDFEDEH